MVAKFFKEPVSFLGYLIDRILYKNYLLLSFNFPKSKLN